MTEVFGYVDRGVMFAHLISGEDIIGDVFDGHDTIKISKPVIPHVQTNGQQFQVSLMPFRPFMDPDADITISKSHVIDILPVGDQMKKLYQQFTSSIRIASPGDIPNLGV